MLHEIFENLDRALLDVDSLGLRAVGVELTSSPVALTLRLSNDFLDHLGLCETKQRSSLPLRVILALVKQLVILVVGVLDLHKLDPVNFFARLHRSQESRVNGLSHRLSNFTDCAILFA